jgi:hypothetical protein
LEVKYFYENNKESGDSVVSCGVQLETENIKTEGANLISG